MSQGRYEIGFIGGGNMAEALIKGLVDGGAVGARAVAVSEPLAARRRSLARRFKVTALADNRRLAASSQILVLAVKPQMMGAVIEELAGAVDLRTTVVSIAAGVTIARLERALGPGTRVVRVMPNTPCLVGRGMSVLCRGTEATAADLRRCRRLFETVGRALVIDDENLMHAVTALSGSGPAYVYMFAEALVSAGSSAGLDRGTAERLALETIAGAAEMMLEAGRPPAELRRAVSSPGGTTVAGIERLRAEGFGASLRSAVKAAARRSRELSRSAGR